MNQPRRARIDWNGTPGWLVLFPNNVAFAIHDQPQEYCQGLPVCIYPWKEEDFAGRIVEWVDEESPT